MGVFIHHMMGNLISRSTAENIPIIPHIHGWTGVDLFFVISGFVIGRSLIPQLSQSSTFSEYRYKTFDFWLKRAYRLLPAAWVWLFITLLLVVFFNESGAFGTTEANIQATLAGLFYFANFRYADAFMNYPYGASFVYWSLSLEEQFYLILPFALFITRRAFPWVLLLIVIYHFPQQRDQLTMSIRPDAICLGLLISIISAGRLSNSENIIKPMMKYFLSITTLLLLGFLLIKAGSYSQNEFPYTVGIIALTSSIIVYLCSYNYNLLSQIPGARILLWIGTRSYAIYLIHIPVFLSIKEIAFRLSWDVNTQPIYTIITALSLTLVLAEINYKLLEKPILSYAKNRSQRLKKAALNRQNQSRTASSLNPPPFASQKADH